jgi:hypothetical protein
MILILSLVCAGCMSYTHIMDSAPIETRTVMMAASDLTDCVMDGFRRQGPPLGVERSRVAGVEHVSGYPTGLFYDVPEATRTYTVDLAFVALSPNETRLEVRSYMSIWGTPSMPPYTWDIIARCTQGMPPPVP